MRNIDEAAETRPATPSWIPLGGILLLFAAMSTVGITWGLPSRNIDKYLFGDGDVWPGEKIYRLAKADAKFSPARGADVDVDPIHKGGGVPIPLTATEEDVAKIYLRYRLYTYQPDEMITMMALAGMRPSNLDFDPRLFQYGGLFLYPVGALIKLCGLLGLIDVRSDVVFYLDNPDEFGKFYIVARAYSAAWGLIGVIVVYAVARRIATHRAGLLAALLFTLMPVVVCMAHEGKPHLPGAVLMLLAVHFAMRCAEPGNAKVEDRSSKIEDEMTASGIGNQQFFRWMCVCCGAALGMVLSSWPVFVLIPLVAIRSASLSPLERAIRILTGTAIAMGVYLVTNPYILINSFANREVLRSNFCNSLAMYEIARVGEGLVRTVELTIEGATLPTLLLGLLGLVLIFVRKHIVSMPLIIVAGLFFLQFVLIGAGKPAEYGRFGLFTNAILAISSACLLSRRSSRWLRPAAWTAAACLAVWSGWCGATYLVGFVADANGVGTRMNLARFCSFLCRDPVTGRIVAPLATFAEPAPYCYPPIDFVHADLRLVHSTSYIGFGPGPDAFAFAPVENADWMFPKYAENLAFAPILRTARFVDDPFLSSMMQGVDSAWRPMPTRLGEFDTIWRSRFVRRETPISWANKPFFDSIFHHLSTQQVVPLGR